MTNVELIENPHALDVEEARTLAEEVQSALHFGSTLASGNELDEMAQIRAMFSWVRLVGGSDRRRTYALVWEMCNAVYRRSTEGKVFPELPAHEGCHCPVNHQVSRDRYNAFLREAAASNHGTVIEMLDAIVGEDIYEDLGGWMCALTDRMAAMRFAPTSA